MLGETAHVDFKLEDIKGRYITNDHIYDFLYQLDSTFNVKNLGTSVLGKPIYGLTIGQGPTRILMWSQMHGNESTTTKAVLDVINYLQLKSKDVKAIFDNCTLLIIPILNPDGAERYTRVNANQVDLNRDAQDLSQPESNILKLIYNEFKPSFCFNLHDQRTIFNVGKTNKPATVSFLAPAFDTNRNNSDSRLQSMQIISAMNIKLQKLIPGQVGRYDDGFNSNCVGDAFQMLKTPTILFEAGHFPGDYMREVTREYIVVAILEAIRTIMQGDYKSLQMENYLQIPENNKLFYDVLVLNGHELDTNLELGTKVGILFKEKLVDTKIDFEPNIELKLAKSEIAFGHETKDASILADRLWLESKDISRLFK